MFLALFPLGYYEFKFNQSSGASGIEVTHLLETARGCGSNPAGTCFLANYSFCAFTGYVYFYYWLGFSGPNFVEGSDFFQVAFTLMFETKPGYLIGFQSILVFFFQIESFPLI